jgi:hypothetical protein
MSADECGDDGEFANSGDEESPFEHPPTPEPLPGTPPPRPPSPAYVRPQPPEGWENLQSAVEVKAKEYNPEWSKKKNKHPSFFTWLCEFQDALKPLALMRHHPHHLSRTNITDATAVRFGQVVACVGLSKVQAKWVVRVVERARASGEYQSLPTGELKLSARDLLSRILCVTETEAEACRRALGGPSTGARLVKDVDELEDLMASPAFMDLPEGRRAAIIQALPRLREQHASRGLNSPSLFCLPRSFGPPARRLLPRLSAVARVS